MPKERPVIIEVNGVSKVFKLPHEKNTSIKAAVVNFYRRKRSYELQEALSNITLSIKQGDFFGIVGRNGSGKSTLLKVLAEIYPATTGTVTVSGSLTPFIELGVGFNPELTGRENVYMNGALLGFSRADMKKKYDDIVEFAELQQFMDQKLKNYSSGMQVRLAFSIAIQSQSDILLFDEVLAVGDANFQRKCYDVFKQIKTSGRTVVLVTHDMSAVQEYCNRAALLDKGKMVMIGDPQKVTKRYNELNLQVIDQQVDKKLEQKKTGSVGYKPVSISDLWLEKKGSKTHTFSPKDPIKLHISFKVHENAEDPVVGITLKDQVGKSIFATNTLVKAIPTGTYKKGDTFNAEFSIDNIYSDGNYYIVPAVTSSDTSILYDSIEEGYRFTIGGWDYPAFVTQPKHTIAINRDKEKP